MVTKRNLKAVLDIARLTTAVLLAVAKAPPQESVVCGCGRSFIRPATASSLCPSCGEWNHSKEGKCGSP